MASYRVQVWSTAGSDFSPNELIQEYNNPLNLGYGSYLNDIGEAFWSVEQQNPETDVRSHCGTGHVFIIRNDNNGNEDVVWRGVLAEHDANDDDAILYAYGYEHLLYSLHSKWKQKWKSSKIAGASGTPIDDLWARAISYADSPLGFVTTGTTEAPYTSDSQSTELVLNKYTVNWKPILTCFKELVAIATSDTNNICFFEIDYPKDPTDHSATFNFWRHNTENNTKLRLVYPDNVLDFSDRFVPVMLRNRTYAVGTGPRGQLYKYRFTRASGPYGRDTFGVRSQNMYLSWVRDRKELKRVTKRRTKLGQREDTNVWVRCYPDTIEPHRATNSTHELGDFVYVDVVRGVTDIRKNMFIVGEQVVFANGREYVQPMLEDRGDISTSYSGSPTWHGLTSNNPWQQYTSGGSGSATQSVTIPEGQELFIFVYTFDNKFSAPVDSVTLNGVAGTDGGRTASTGVWDRQLGYFYWTNGQVPDGETVDLVMNWSTPYTSNYIHYGGISAAADGDDATRQDVAATASSGSHPAATVDSGSVESFGIAFTFHNGSLSTTKAGSSFLIQNGAVTGTGSLSVTYEDTPTTGSRSIGGGDTVAHTTYGTAWKND